MELFYGVDDEDFVEFPYYVFEYKNGRKNYRGVFKNKAEMDHWWATNCPWVPLLKQYD